MSLVSMIFEQCVSFIRFVVQLISLSILDFNIGTWAAKTLLSTGILPHLFDPIYRMAGAGWSDISRRCGLSYPAPSELEIVTAASIPAMFRYAMRHAMAGYTPLMLAMLRIVPLSFALPFRSTSNVLKYCFGIDAKDIVDFKKYQKTDQPSFYVCADHAMQHIVVSVRGTMPWNVLDWLTDLNAKSVPANGGVVHGGMYEAAKYVLHMIEKGENESAQRARQLLTKNATYDMIFCGHSLGAGTVALMALRLLDGSDDFPLLSEWAKQKKLKVFAFASPSVASSGLLQADQEWNKVVTTAVLTTDLVPRCSARSFETLDERVRFVEKWKLGLGFGRELPVEKLKAMGKTEGQMFPLGRVLWYVPNEVLGGEGENKKEEVAGHWLFAKVKTVLAKLDPRNLPIYGSKYRENYSARQYTMCEVGVEAEHKQTFQNIIVDRYSVQAHEPHRYLWAGGFTLKE